MSDDNQKHDKNLKTSIEDELAAMENMASIMLHLDNSAKKRVLKWLIDFYAIESD